MTPEEVGRFVRLHRKQAGLTQKGLGDLAGIGKTAVFDIEHGKATVRMDTLMKVLAVIVYQAMGRPLPEIEETALPLGGRKKRLGKKLWTRYLAEERMGLPSKVVEGILDRFSAVQSTWRARVHDSFLSDPARALYLKLLAERAKRLRLQR